MLRQKKMCLKNTSVDQSLQTFLNLNIRVKEQIQELKNSKSFKPHAKILKNNQTQNLLRQIDTNRNMDYRNKKVNNPMENNKLLFSFGKNFTLNKTQKQNSIFKQIINLVSNQQLKLPQCTKSQSKRLLVFKQRPNTSLGLQNIKNKDQSFIHQAELAFQLSEREEVQGKKDILNLSKSRALMNFSKVYRNASLQRFRMQRDKPIFRNSALLYAQSIAIQAKQRKQKIIIPKSTYKNVLAIKTSRQKAFRQRKNRYTVEQQFKLAGWDFQ